MSIFLRQSTSIDVRIGPFVDVGDGFTPETGVTIASSDEAEILKANGAATVAMAGTFAAVTGCDGWYDYTLSTGDTDTVGELVIVMQDDSVYLPVFMRFYVVEEAVYDAMYTASATGPLQGTTAGNTLDVTATGEAGIDLDNAAGALGTSQFDNDFLTAALIANGAIDAATFAAGAIDAAAIATGAIDADALAADAVTEIRSLASGTSDAGGSTTTMVDAARTEADDVWNYNWILFTSGALANQCRLITDFVASTDTITFTPAVTASVGAGFTYEILPAASVDLQSWRGTVSAGALANVLVSGRVDSRPGALAANVITAASINAAAITAAKFAAGAVDANAIAANAIGASELATDAVNEIRDSILSDATTFAGANIDAAISSRATPAQVNTECDTALSDIHLDHLFQTDYDPASKPGVATALLNELVESDGGVSRFTANAIENWVKGALTIVEPSAGAPSATPDFEEWAGVMWALVRNKVTATATLLSAFNDAGTNIFKATLSDDGTTFTREELVAP